MTDSTIPARFEVQDELAHGEGEILLPFAQAFLDRLRPERKVVTSSDLHAAITHALRDDPDQTPRMGHRSKDSDGQFGFFTQRP